VLSRGGNAVLHSAVMPSVYLHAPMLQPLSQWPGGQIVCVQIPGGRLADGCALG